MMTDPIADMLTRIRNAQMARQREVVFPFSKLKYAIAQILSSTSYIGEVKRTEGTPAPLITVTLKYHGTKPAIQSIVRESKPGHRMYRSASELPRVLNGYGIAVVSTSQGIMSAEDARQKGIGGEVICSVY